MALGALISGAAGITGGLIQNRAQKKEAQKDRDFQERMSSTAHQRQVKDLKAAGLNPLLSATGGASSPSGSMAQLDNITQGGVTSALEAARLQKDIGLADSQILLQTEQAGSAMADKQLTSAKQAVLEAQMPSIISTSKRDKMQADWDRKAIEFDNYMKRIQGTIGTIPLPGKGLKKTLPRRN